MKTTLNSPLSSANICRERGWGVGTHLQGADGSTVSTIVITAVGEHSILAKVLCENGQPVENGCETTWTLACRDWHEAPKPGIWNGVPEDPRTSRFHWLRLPAHPEPIPVHWRGDTMKWMWPRREKAAGEFVLRPLLPEHLALQGCRYLGRCLTPDEVRALRENQGDAA